MLEMDWIRTESNNTPYQLAKTEYGDYRIYNIFTERDLYFIRNTTGIVTRIGRYESDDEAKQVADKHHKSGNKDLVPKIKLLPLK